MSRMRLRSDLPVELIQSVGSDEMIVNAARVSTGLDKVKFHPDDDTAGSGLINFLVKNRHGSPFEHGSMTFRVEAPIFVAREFMRHRIGWSYNEESGRYKVLNGEFYVPDGNRPLVQVGRPGHYQFEPGTVAQMSLCNDALETSYRQAWDSYQFSLTNGIAKEVARMCLPVGTYTSFYATCNPRSLMHFLSLRTHDGASLFPSYPMHEIESVAIGMENEFEKLYPRTHEAFERNGRVAP